MIDRDEDKRNSIIVGTVERERVGKRKGKDDQRDRF